jgi:hypothetical protein
MPNIDAGTVMISGKIKFTTARSHGRLCRKAFITEGMTAVAGTPIENA